MFIEIVRFITLQLYNYAPKVVINWENKELSILFLHFIGKYYGASFPNILFLHSFSAIHTLAINNNPQHSICTYSTKKMVHRTKSDAPLFILECMFYLYDSLSHHSLCNFHEAGNVCALHVVYIAVSLCTVLHAVLVDVLHDPEELSVNFLRSPRQTL